MSSSAPAGKPQTGYEVSRPQGQCAVCGKSIEPDSRMMAALQETAAGFARIDTCLECWAAFDRKDVVAFWQTMMPRAEAKKKLFVDDTVLCELFERLSDVQEPAKVSFRFMLGLILMRKRLVIYERTERQEGHDVWKVRMKGKDQVLDLIDPKLDEAGMKEVSQQLGEILHQEL